MLYSRYGYNAKEVLLMPFDEGLEMIITAQRMNNEEKMFLRWVVSYQTSMTYEDFKSKIENANIQDDRTEEDILDSVENIMRLINGTEHI